MADNVVQTIFTADATQAVAAAEVATAATQKAAAKMQEAVSKPLSYQTAAQPGSINNPVGRQTVAQREAAAASVQLAKANSVAAKEAGAVNAATAAYAKTLSKASAESATAIDRAKNLGKSLSFVRENAQRAAGAVLLAFGVAKTIDLFINRTENARAELAKLTEAANKFGDSALFNAKSAGAGDVEKQIANLRRNAQSEIEKLQQDTAEANKSYGNILKAAVGLGPGTEDRAAAAKQAIEKINSQVNATAKAIEKTAADEKLKAKKDEGSKLAEESSKRAKEMQDEARRLNAESIEDEKERAAELFKIEYDAIQARLGVQGQTKAEVDSIFALSKATFAKYQSEMTALAKEEADKREEDNRRAVRQMISDWEALRGAIDSAYQSQQQFSSSQFNFGSDIRAIRQLLEVRGGWKR